MVGLSRSRRRSPRKLAHRTSNGAWLAPGHMRFKIRWSSLTPGLEEQMAQHYCRWDPQLKMIGLRFSNVIDPTEYGEFSSFEDDPASRKWNLWSYIDARDGAQAVVRALEYQTPGFDSFVIANNDNVMSRVLRRPDGRVLPRRRVPLAGRRHPIAHLHREGTTHAWLTPQHSWRDHSWRDQEPNP
jgi:nucleoside-diphosphate-sugar epimerase